MKTAAITIQTLSGPRDVQAVILGPVAVHREQIRRQDGSWYEDKDYTVTHVRTGRRLPGVTRTKAMALSVAKLYAGKAEALEASVIALESGNKREASRLYTEAFGINPVATVLAAQRAASLPTFERAMLGK